MKRITLTLSFILLCKFMLVAHSQSEPATSIGTIEDCFNDNQNIQVECITSEAPAVEVKNLICSSDGLGSAQFSLCNHQKEIVTAISIDPESQNYVQQLYPELPLSIASNMCVEITVAGIEQRRTIDDCHPESTLCLQTHAKMTDGFNCSGDYGFGYIFQSESENIQGLSGFVSLYSTDQ